MIPYEAGLRHSERPVSLIELCGPVHELVHHHGSSPLSDSLDSTFGDTCLMMCSDTAVGDGLTQTVKLSAEELRVEGGIVGAVTLDLDTEVAGGALERAFAN